MKYDLISCLLTNLCSYIILYHGFHMVITPLNNLEEPSRNMISSVQLWQSETFTNLWSNAVEFTLLFFCNYTVSQLNLYWYILYWNLVAAGWQKQVWMSIERKINKHLELYKTKVTYKTYKHLKTTLKAEVRVAKFDANQGSSQGIIKVSKAILNSTQMVNCIQPTLSSLDSCC